MAELVSVIIPSYNLAKTLPRCLESVLAQTYRELEILVVDDGSEDGTREVLARYEKKDARIHALYQENAGVSAARNRALERMHGTYYIFLDADDTLRRDAVERLVQAQAENSLDFITADRAIVTVMEDGQEKCVSRLPLPQMYPAQEEWEAQHIGALVLPGTERLTSAEARAELCTGRYCLQSACHKLFSAALGGDLRYDFTIRNGEDRLYVYQYLRRCASVLYLSQPLWNVYVRADSVSHAALDRKWMTMIEVMDRILQEEPEDEIRRDYRKQRMELIVLYIDAYLSRDSKDPEFFRALRRLAREGLHEYRRDGAALRERLDAWKSAYAPPFMIKEYLKWRGKKL